MQDAGLTPGAAIAAAAARRGWDSDELADRIQVSRSLVATWVDGSVEPPDRFHRRLTETLEFTPEELAALTGEEPEAVEPEPEPPELEPEAVEPEPDAPIDPDLELPELPEIEPLPPLEPPPEAKRTLMTAGHAIQEARRRKGMTTRELAAAIHYTKTEVESWEDDAAAPWKFALRSMTDLLDFTDEETAAVERAVED